MAMAALCWAKLIVATMPFASWRDTLGGKVDAATNINSKEEARRFAAHVEWAARQLPFSTKCLPRAMALSWILRSRNIGHYLVFAVRPVEQRGSDDDLHAWLEIGNERIIGDIAGPWIETLRLGAIPPGSHRRGI